MKIVTYNVNGIRSAIGKGLCDWIADERPDRFCSMFFQYFHHLSVVHICESD